MVQMRRNKVNNFKRKCMASRITLYMPPTIFMICIPMHPFGPFKI